MHYATSAQRSDRNARPRQGEDGLRIGIDATCLASRRGYGRFLRELLPPLLAVEPRHEYVLFADRHVAEELETLPVRVVTAETVHHQANAASAEGRRGLLDLWCMGRAVSREPLDAFYFPSVYSYFPLLSRTPVLVGFHDTIAERHGRVVFPSWQTRLAWNAKVALARHQARVLVTVSEWSRHSLADWFGVVPRDIHVTVEAPSTVFQPAAGDSAEASRAELVASLGLPVDARYMIYVGGFNPHKNLERLVDAFAAAQQAQGEDLWLLMVGDFEGDVFHADVVSLRARIERSGIADRVRFPGFVPDEKLRHLYAGATALLIPSLEEGFGLPAVEAAACGTPCVATERSPLPQILEGGGLFVDPEDEAALTAAVTRLATEPGLRDRLGDAALAGARALSWRDTATATVRAFEYAAGVAG